VETLLRRGHEVKALVQYNSRSEIGWLEELQIVDPGTRLEIVLGDLRDPGLVNTVVEGCDAAINLAALIAIPHSYSSPRSYIDTNVLGTHNFLEACRTSGVKRVVQLSTSEVYGSAVYVPMDEGHPLSAQSPYAATKIASDQLAFSYNKSFGLPVVVARPFNAFGPRQSLRAVVPSIILQAISGDGKVKLGSTSSTRDFTHVQDLAAGLADILESDRGEGEVFNLGSGFEISISDVVQLVSQILDVELEIEAEEGRFRPENSEVSRLYSDSRKAQSVFGWGTFSESPLERFTSRLAETASWFAQNQSSYAGDLRTFRY